MTLKNLDKFLDGIVADIRGSNLDTLVVAMLIADKFKIPLWYQREPKEHGTKKEIEGNTKKLYEMLTNKKKIYILKEYLPKEAK